MFHSWVHPWPDWAIYIMEVYKNICKKLNSSTVKHNKHEEYNRVKSKNTDSEIHAHRIRDKIGKKKDLPCSGSVRTGYVSNKMRKRILQASLLTHQNFFIKFNWMSSKWHLLHEKMQKVYLEKLYLFNKTKKYHAFQVLIVLQGDINTYKHKFMAQVWYFNCSDTSLYIHLHCLYSLGVSKSPRNNWKYKISSITDSQKTKQQIKEDGIRDQSENTYPVLSSDGFEWIQ